MSALEINMCGKNVKKAGMSGGQRVKIGHRVNIGHRKITFIRSKPMTLIFLYHTVAI